MLFSITGVTTAPTPSPLTIISGGDRYCLPEFKTKTSTIWPLASITGWSCACAPGMSVMSGWRSKLTISEDPYPTPLFSKCTEVQPPLKIGWIVAWNVSDPIDEIPTFPTKDTVIGW